MKIGILCAGDTEVAPFLPLIEESTITEKAMLKFYEGRIGGAETVVLFSGVCKVNAAIAAQIMLDTFHVDAIINAGTAGGMHPEVKIFDTVISTEAVYHDVDEGILTEFHPWMDSVYFRADEKLLELSHRAADRLRMEGDIWWGRMATGEAFVSDEARKAINEKYSPLSVDMETAAIAHVCYVNRKPFIAVRCITDNTDHDGAQCFERNCEKASAIAKDVTLAMLSELAGMAQC